MIFSAARGEFNGRWKKKKKFFFLLSFLLSDRVEPGRKEKVGQSVDGGEMLKRRLRLYTSQAKRRRRRRLRVPVVNECSLDFSERESWTMRKKCTIYPSEDDGSEREWAVSLRALTL